jgi:hypothetical protein
MPESLRETGPWVGSDETNKVWTPKPTMVAENGSTALKSVISVVLLLPLAIG